MTSNHRDRKIECTDKHEQIRNADGASCYECGETLVGDIRECKKHVLNSIVNLCSSCHGLGNTDDVCDSCQAKEDRIL